MKRVLILTASFGDGHNAAARSVRDAIAQTDPNAQVEMLDLLAKTYGSFNTLSTSAYRLIVRYAPALWSQVFNVFNNPALFQRQMGWMGKLRQTLTSVLRDMQPDTIVSTYPVYSHVLSAIGGAPCRVITIITDSISVCSAWYNAPSDIFVVANNETAQVLLKAGVPAVKIRDLGFPVNPVFAQSNKLLPPPGPNQPPKAIYVINTGKALAGKSLEQLLQINNLELTITAGRNASLRAKLAQRFSSFGSRVHVMGWTDQMPQLLMSHHILIAKAGGAMVQEAMAARCPMIINQVIPGQEEGNAWLIQELGAGAVASGHNVADIAAQAFADNAHLWRQWRGNLERTSRPDAALRIADLVLEKHPAAPKPLLQPA